jgi:hypothetical protein
MDEAKLIEQLQKVPLTRLYLASQKGLVRLHLFATGRIHELMLEFEKDARAIILKRADSEGKLDGVRGLATQADLLKRWSDTFEAFSMEFLLWREQAGMMPYGDVPRSPGCACS